MQRDALYSPKALMQALLTVMLLAGHTPQPAHLATLHTAYLSETGCLQKRQSYIDTHYR
jgi:hypothetical protein